LIADAARESVQLASVRVPPQVEFMPKGFFALAHEA
jgi:hypothetical protein